MPESKQLKILKRLTALLDGITPAEIDPATGVAYAVDLAGKNFRGITVIGQDTKLPATTILEAPQPINGEPADDLQTRRHENWRLLLQGFAVDDKENPTDPAYVLKAIVEQRLSRIVAEEQGDPVYPDDFLLGKLCTGFVIGQGVVRPPTKEVSPTAFFYIPLTVKLATDVTNPYKD